MKKCNCGGTAKMKTGGATKGGTNAKMGIYGIPNAGRTDSLGFKKGGAIKNKKMKLGGDPGDPKPNSVLKNLGITGLAGGLMGLLTTEEGIKKRADNASARHMRKQTKRILKK
jgi:hypothetical protein